MPGQYIKNLIAALWRESPLNTALALRQTPHLPGTQSCVIRFCNVLTRWVLCCSHVVLSYHFITCSASHTRSYHCNPLSLSKVDRIKRYGGTTSSEKPWPEEPERLTDEELSDTVAHTGGISEGWRCWRYVRKLYIYIVNFWILIILISVGPPQTFQGICLMMLGSSQHFLRWSQMGK